LPPKASFSAKCLWPSLQRLRKPSYTDWPQLQLPCHRAILGCAAVGFLAGLVLLAPLTGATVGSLLGGAGTAASVTAVGIGDDFVREAEGLMKLGTSALFVLDSEGNMEVILHAIQGLGGTV
jgi:uncharacterized membrane protein